MAHLYVTYATILQNEFKRRYTSTLETTVVTSSFIDSETMLDFYTYPTISFERILMKWCLFAITQSNPNTLSTQETAAYARMAFSGNNKKKAFPRKVLQKRNSLKHF